MRASPDLAPWKFRGNHITDPDPAFFYICVKCLRIYFIATAELLKKMVDRN